MSFRGRGGNRGGGGRGRGGGGRGGFGGGRGPPQDLGPPEQVVELGVFTHPCENQLVCKCTTEKVPYFNAPVFLENKQQIGKIDEIFGSLRNHCFSVILSDDVKASSFKENDKIFIDPYKLLPLERFLPGAQQRGGGRGRGGARGGRGGGDRGGGRGGRGGGGRGGFSGGRGGFGGGDRGGRGGFGGGDRGGFRGRGGFGDRGGRGGDRGGFNSRGRGGFGGNGGGGFKRSFDGGAGGQGNKRQKFE